MFIAFLVLAAAALIFLFVYNTRNVRKAERNSRQKPEPAKTRSKQAIEERLPERKEASKLEESKDSSVRVQESGERESGADDAYRDAIRRFAEREKQATQRAESDHGDRGSPDHSYREALRSMSKGEDGEDDKNK
ncbi:hypothetical protein OIN60_02285 [Paenibacillus sp. P96]|uniref:Uncharacterized protein n=1 Tax=Paenibacillus zeirhizosphaerae TaxID=2987519 RepID=A0ABT9FLK9_9BACL|nr:hypothetical protein [Paenibacillus sp. P96]MDP4095620.1 hypothetical protein [Paenibacillus sp. P96]